MFQPKMISSWVPRYAAFALILTLALAASGCVAIPKAPLTGGKVIAIGDGTEDIVLDDFGQQHKLYVSCDDRRNRDAPQFGAIVSYDLASGEIDTMPIKEYPFGLTFRPHGLDLQQVGERLHLYVVCHDDTAGHHWIAQFQVLDGALFWIRNYHADLLTSPNGVTAMPDGSLYVTNDHRVRGDFGEAIWKKKVATIVRFEPDATPSIAFTGLCYGNGINNRNGYVYAAATRENAVYRFKVEPDGKLTQQTRIAKVVGPDNLRWDGDDLLVACHMRSFKFLKHAKHPEKHSPTVVYRIQLDQRNAIPVYADKSGKTISAGATGLIYQGRLFIGQVFGNYIVEVKQ
jgi:hypothetical protein